MESVGGFKDCIYTLGSLFAVSYASVAYVSYLHNSLEQSSESSSYSKKLIISSCEIFTMAWVCTRCLMCKKYKQIKTVQNKIHDKLDIVSLMNLMGIYHNSNDVSNAE
jgi:hypothetical protein